MGKNILITGGAGRLARYVAEELKGDNNVTLFDLVTPDSTPTPWETDCKFVLGSLTDLGDCMRAITLSQAEVIIHLGAITHTTDQQPGKKMIQRRPEDTTMQVNVMGTYYLMDAARRIGTVKKVIFASSYYALGLGGRLSGAPYQVDYLPIDEDHPMRPEDTYALSKVLGEEIIEAYCRAYGFKAVAFRLMGVVYPFREFETNVPVPPNPDFKGGPVRTTWQYSDCRDIAYACRLAMEKDLENDFEPFYIVTDSTYPNDTKEVVEKSLPDLKEMAKNIKEGEGLITDAKLRKMLGYKPRHSWR
ncbi:MAG: NAD(P)-dependent oxidoreductase [Oscillospiraceae bacterium]|jgi:nucleoside-diphosphate-sugar epimerase|nr:NAD(P)-dependent oxidoreductase [Oscillospiraceae bacterium]